MKAMPPTRSVAIRPRPGWRTSQKRSILSPGSPLAVRAPMMVWRANPNSVTRSGIAITWACRSPKCKLKKGNSWISKAEPMRVAHHHQ
jgi:hypothetical protein